MNAEQIHDIVERIETAKWPDSALAAAVLESVNSALPNQAGSITPQSSLLESTDAALHLLSLNLPGWSVTLQGYAHEPDSQWTCTIREGTVSDDDDLIGIGQGPTPPLALLSALLRIAVIRASGRW